jgi:Flp pilus assembly protein TadG
VHRFFRITSNSRGNAVVEFALVLPILLLVLFGITEFGRAIMTKNILFTAAREGARLAAVSPFSDSLSVQGRVIDILSAANVDAKEITISYDPATRSIQVAVTNDFEVLSAGILGSFVGVFELRGVTSMRYEG